MLSLVTTNKFRKDFKRIKKRGRSLNKLEIVLENLLQEEVLDKKVS